MSGAVVALTGLGFCFAPAARAANVTLTATDAASTSSFNSAGKWSNNAASSSANNYFTGAFALRSPANSTSYSFAGASLSVDAGGGSF